MKVVRAARDDTPEKHERSEEVNFPFDAKRTSGFPSPGRLEYILHGRMYLSKYLSRGKLYFEKKALPGIALDKGAC